MNKKGILPTFRPEFACAWVNLIPHYAVCCMPPIAAFNMETPNSTVGHGAFGIMISRKVF